MSLLERLSAEYRSQHLSPLRLVGAESAARQARKRREEEAARKAEEDAERILRQRQEAEEREERERRDAIETESLARFWRIMETFNCELPPDIDESEKEVMARRVAAVFHRNPDGTQLSVRFIVFVSFLHPRSLSVT